MKKLFILFLFACSVAHADNIRDIFSVTNLPINGDTMAYGSDTRTLTTGTVTSPATQIAVGSTTLLTTSNIFLALSAVRGQFPPPSWDGVSTNIGFYGAAPLVITTSPGWATNRYTTNSSTPQLLVSVNASGNAGMNAVATSNQVAMASGIVAGINASASNFFQTNIPALALYPDLFNVQTISNKTMVNATNVGGVITNATAISAISAGLAAVLKGVFTYTGQTNYAAIITDQSGNILLSLDGQGNLFVPSLYGVDTFIATNIMTRQTVNASDVYSTNGFQSWGFVSEGHGDLTHPLVYIFGTNGLVADAFQIYHDNQVTLDFNVNSNGVTHARAMTAGYYSNAITAGTNTLGGVLIYPRFNNTSLANGGNAAVNVSTNRYVKLSGPTGAFSIAGIAGGLPDREIVLLNSTSQAMTISNDSGTDPTATNRVYTAVNSASGSDIVGSNAITLLYDFAQTHWVVIGAR